MSPSVRPREEASLPLQIRLYIAGDSPNSARAVANLDAALTDLGGSLREVEIVDVLRAPERGLRDGVLVTPMLVRLSPLPERRILGNLSDGAVLRAVLTARASSDE